MAITEMAVWIIRLAGIGLAALIAGKIMEHLTTMVAAR